MQRDAFTRAKTARAEAAVTRPLGPANPSSSTTPDLAGAQVALALKHLETFEGRIEMLARACVECGIDVPGGTVETYHHEVNQQQQRCIDYIAYIIEIDGALRRAALVAIHRYRDVADTVGWRTPDQGRHPPDARIFQRQVFSLANLGGEFRHDPLLAQIFPSAIPIHRNAADKMVQAQRDREINARRLAFERAQALIEAIEPKMRLVEKALAEAERGILRSLAGLVGGNAGREALEIRKLAAVFKARPDVALKLRGAIEQSRDLKAHLLGGPDLIEFAIIRKLAFPLGRLAALLQDQTALRAFFAGPMAD